MCRYISSRERSRITYHFWGSIILLLESNKRTIRRKFSNWAKNIANIGPKVFFKSSMQIICWLQIKIEPWVRNCFEKSYEHPTARIPGREISVSREIQLGPKDSNCYKSRTWRGFPFTDVKINYLALWRNKGITQNS